MIKKFISLILGILILFISHTNARIPILKVDAPKKDDKWIIGSSQNITWTAKGVTGNLIILLRRSNKNIGIIKRKYTRVSFPRKSLQWTVGDYIGGRAPAGENYFIRIQIKGTDYYADGGPFTIVEDHLKTLPLQYQKSLTTSLCKIQGTIMKVPNYLELEVVVYSGKGRFQVPPGTRMKFFNLPQKCNSDEPKTPYRLTYRIRRHCGSERHPQWSDWKTQYQVDCREITSEKPVYLDYPRYFDQLTSTGILIRKMTTDKDSYQFGEIINLTIKAVIKAPGRTKAIREDATYKVRISCSGITHEVDQGDLKVTLGEEKILSIPIHHTLYSLGYNKIELEVFGPDYEYNFTYSISRYIR